MALAPALPEGVFAVTLLFYLLAWGVALGLAYCWLHTFHVLFQGIANALNYDKKLRGLPDIHIHLGGWAKTIDHKAIELLTDWALGCEIIVGKTWHGMAEMFWAMSHAISDAAGETLDFGHWVVHTAIPGHAEATQRPWKNKSNAAAAAVAAAAAAVAALKKATRAEHRAEQAATAAAKSAAQAAAHDAHTAGQVATTTATTVVEHTKVITQVVDVPALPVPFGRTAKQLWRLVRKHETIIGATVFAAAMANVLGLPNPRCLTKGPMGRFARTLCGMPTSLLNDFLGLLADFYILENICTVLPWIETAASEVGTPLVEVLTDVGAGLCRGSKPPAALRGPTPSVPALIFGVSASGV